MDESSTGVCESSRCLENDAGESASLTGLCPQEGWHSKSGYPIVVFADLSGFAVVAASAAVSMRNRSAASAGMGQNRVRSEQEGVETAARYQHEAKKEEQPSE